MIRHLRSLGAALRGATHALPRGEACCGTCRHFADDRARVEQCFPSLLVLSSAFGDSWGDAGLCTLRGEMCLPFHACPDYATETPSPPGA